MNSAHLDDVMIIGGGIGGLCTAIALRQRGITARVYESSAEVRAVGAGIIIAPNGMRVLAQLGLAVETQALGAQLDSLMLTDAQGVALLKTPARAELIRDFGFSLTGLLRAELYQLLLQHLPAETVIGGKTLTQFEDNGEAVTTIFADGTRARGTLLIGADGIHSVIRQQLFPHIAPLYAGQTSYRGVAGFSLPEQRGPLACEAWGAQIRLGIVAVSATQTYWYATHPARAGERIASKADALSALRKLASDFSAPFTRVLENTPETRLIRTDMYDLPPLPSWHRGRVVLLGDAAHATTPNLGQGGNQAIEDALALAAALTTHPGHTEAFSGYQRARKVRAEMIVARSRQLGAIVHLPQRWQRVLRDALLRLVPASVGRRQNHEIFGG